MKRGGDLYPHKPSPGHTLDEVLKSLRDLIRNDLPAGLAEASSPATDATPAPAESGISAPAPPAPDPSSGELVNEVLAGLERELAELDDLDRSIAQPSDHDSVPETETLSEAPDEIAAAPPADSDQPFTEEDVRHAIEDQADDESAAEENQEQGAAESPDDDFPEDDFAEDGFPDETGPSAIAAETEAFTDDAMPADMLEPEAEPEIPAGTDAGAVTEPEPEIESSPEPGFHPGPEVEFVPLEVSAPHTEPVDIPAQPRMPAATPPARLRDSLALIAPGREERDEGWSRPAFVAPSAIAQPEWPDEASAPVPESDAIPLLDDAIESGLPPDFAVRVRAIAIQAAARLEHEMRRAGRTPIATDLVPALARILEEALAQEFAQRQNDGFGEQDK